MKLFKNIIITVPIILSFCVGYQTTSFSAEKTDTPVTSTKKSTKSSDSSDSSKSIKKSSSSIKKPSKLIKKSSSSIKKPSKLIKKSSLTRKKSKFKSSLSPTRKQKKLSTSSLQKNKGLKMGYCNSGRKTFRLSEKMCDNRKGSFFTKREGAQKELREMNRHSSMSAASLIKKRNRGVTEFSPQEVGSGLLRDGSGPRDLGQFEPDLEKDVRAPLPAGINWGKVHGAGGAAGNDYIDAFLRWIDQDIDQSGANDLADGPQDGGDWHMRGDGEWERGAPPGGRGWDPLSDLIEGLERLYDDVMGNGPPEDPGDGLTPEEIADLIGTDDDDSSDSNDGTGGNTSDDDDNDDGDDDSDDSDDSDDGDDGDDGDQDESDDSSNSDSGDSGDDEGDDTEEGSEEGQPTGGDRGGRGGDGPSLGAQLSSKLSVDLSTGRKKHQRVTGGGGGGGHISTPLTQPGKGDKHQSDTPDIQTEPENNTRTGEGVRPIRQHDTPGPGVGPNAQPGVDYEEDGPEIFMNRGSAIRLPDWIIDDPRVNQ